MPQAWAGFRSEPPMSLPSPSGLIPDAMAAPSPPLEPPAVLSGLQGFFVRPKSDESVWTRSPMSGILVRPSGIAPAAFMRSTPGASDGAIASAKIGSPFVVGCPSTSMLVLMVNGTPWNVPSVSPRETAASAASASRRASSLSTCTIALTCSFTCSMRVRCASTTSREEKEPSRIPAASSSALCCQSSSAMVAPLYRDLLS